MRPNPRDLEHAIHAAQADSPRPEAEARAVAALRAPLRARRLVTVPRVAVMAAAATGVLLLPLVTPRQAGAWAQVAAATAKEVRIHERTTMLRNGKPVFSTERWSEPHRYASTYGGRFEGKMGYDGRRAYQYNLVSGYATVETEPRASMGNYSSLFGAISSISIDEIVKDPESRSPREPKQVDTPDGPRMQYRIQKQVAPGAHGWDEVRVYTEVGDPRVRRWEVLNGKGDIEYFGELDYPKTIPDEVFAFDPPKSLRLYDMDVERPRLERAMAKGFGTKKVNGQTVTLRGVVRGGYNDLYVLWTGTPPNGDLKPAVKVQGVRAITSPNSLAVLTNKVYEFVPEVKKAGFLPSRLAGMGFYIKGKVPEKVNVTLPVFAPDKTRPVKDFVGQFKGYRSRYVGSVKFENVPILRPGPFYMHLNHLGLQPKRPYEALVRDYGRGK